MAIVFSPGREYLKTDIEQVTATFSDAGVRVGDGNRNMVKFFEVQGLKLNFKRFKKPNLVNKIAYRYFRKSKARRSFENAHLLINKGFFTPEPIAYIENLDAIGLTTSYYICEQLENIFELRQAILDTGYPDRENIIKQYTAYFFRMHEEGIEFLDNSPGNSLLEKQGDAYKIYLVDLNRMHTGKQLSLEERMQNFSRVSEERAVLKLITDEYARLSGKPAEQLYSLLEKSTDEFWKNLRRKKRLKKKLKAFKHSFKQ